MNLVVERKNENFTEFTDSVLTVQETPLVITGARLAPVSAWNP